MNEDESAVRLRERFVRWQSELRQSLSTHAALVAAFASGGVGFVGSILNDTEARFGGCTSWLILAAGVFFLLSLFLALFISFNRLRDVRSTLEILRHRRDKSSDEIITELQTRTAELGKTTWALVYWQFGTFAVAAALFLAGVFFAFEHRMFPAPEPPKQNQTKLNAAEHSTATPNPHEGCDVSSIMRTGALG